MFKRIALSLMVLMLLVTAGLTGCKQEPAATDPTVPKGPTRMTIAVGSPMDGFDPINDSIPFLVQTAVFDALVRVEADMSISPLIASSWQDSADRMSMVFNLREDITFHDGTKLTAEDVVFSLNTLLTTPMGMAYINYIGQAELVGKYAVRIPKMYPDVKILTVLAGVAIVPEGTYLKDTSAFRSNPIGSGPYRFGSFRLGEALELRANENYFLGKPGIDQVAVKSILNPSAAVIALESNEVDMIFHVAAIEQRAINQRAQLSLQSVPGFGQYALSLLKGNLPDNLKLRQAIYHGINAEEALLVAYEGDGVVAKDIYSQAVMGEFHGVIDHASRYKPDLARTLLAESGYNPSQPLVISVMGELQAKVAQAVANNLNDLGMNVKVEMGEMMDVYTRWMSGDLDMMVAQMGGALFAIEDLLNWYTTQGDFYGMNPGKDPVFDELFSKVRMETDRQLKNTYMKQALQMFADKYFIVPLFTVNTNVAYNNRIKNVKATPSHVYYYVFDFTID